MKNFIISGILIIGSFCGGYFVGQKVSKKKYEDLADKEIESVKESLEAYYIEKSSKKYDDLANEASKNLKKESVVKKPSQKPTINIPLKDREAMNDYKDYAKPYQTTSSSNRIVGDPSQNFYKKEESQEQDIYIMNPTEFSESDYESKTLNYYTDKVLADDDGNIILNVSEHVGDDALRAFGKYEEDVVYVRNNILGIDYEILLDQRSYKQAAPRYMRNGIDLGDDDE